MMSIAWQPLLDQVLISFLIKTKNKGFLVLLFSSNLAILNSLTHSNLKFRHSYGHITNKNTQITRFPSLSKYEQASQKKRQSENTQKARSVQVLSVNSVQHVFN